MSGTPRMSSPRQALFALVILAALLPVAPGCGEKPREDVSLPGKDDLYKYSLAVARRARSLVPPDRARALFNIGFVHERFGMEEKAEELFLQGLAINPVTVDVYESLAELYSLTNRGAEAIHACHMALKYDPAARGIWTRIGEVLSHMQKHEEAIEAFRTELRKKTGDAWTHYNLGLACKNLELWEEAAAGYLGAIELDPVMREALYGMVEALRRLGRKDEASSYLRRWETLKKEQAEKELKLRANEENDDLKQQNESAALTWLDAAELFKDEIKLAPDNRQRQEAFLNHAKEALEGALELNPAERTTHIMRLDIAAKTGTQQDLITATTRAADSLPNDPLFSFKLAEAHAKILVSGKGNQSIHAVAAEQAVRKTLGISPNHAEANRLLAELLLSFGQRNPNTLKEILSHAKKAVAYSKIPHAGTYDILAKAYLVSGRIEDAGRTLEEGLSKLPVADATGRAVLQGRLRHVRKSLQSGGK